LISRKLIGIISGLATAATVLVPLAASAAPTPSAPTTAEAHFETAVRHSGMLLHYGVGGKDEDWMGSYDINGKVVICLSPGKILKAPPSWHNGTFGTKKQTAQLSYLFNNGGNAPNTPSGRVTATAARIDMLKITGGLGYYKHLVIPGNVATEASKLMTATLTLAGPYAKNLSINSQPTTPGQFGSATLNVISSSQHRVTGFATKFSATNAAISTDGRTGVAQRFERTGTGRVTIGATTTVSSDELSVGSAGKAFQTLVSGLTSVIGASNGYQSRAAGAKVSVSCAQCGGSGKATATISQAAGAAEGRYVMLANGKPVGSATIPSSKHAVSGSFESAKAVANGSSITFTASYKVNGKWTTPVALGGTFKVNCPVFPLATATTKCDCATGSDSTTVTITVKDTGSAADVLAYAVGSGPFAAVTVAPGATKTVVLNKVNGTVTYYASVKGTTMRTPSYLAGIAS
jgi:hypothetical protein